MMKHVIVAAALTASTLAVAPPANADTPGCVTRGEYRSVPLNGTWSKAKVSRVFDTAGERLTIQTTQDATYETRRYRSCLNPKYASVEVAFIGAPGGTRRWAYDKWAFWG